MFKDRKNTNVASGTGAAPASRFDISPLDFGIPSDFGFRISDFRRTRRRGFSFTEIMFAVIILGVGFIMVAAIFPVAIQQAKTTTEETTAASIARGAANYLQNIVSDGASPPSSTNCPQSSLNVANTGTPAQINVSFVQQITTIPTGSANDAPRLWIASANNQILPNDPRYGYIYLFRRGLDQTSSPSPYAQVYIFPVQSRATTTFGADDLTLPSTWTDDTNSPKNSPPANLMARFVQVAVSNDVAEAGGVDLIAFDKRPSSTGMTSQKAANADAAVEGAYVVIADDKLNNSPPGTQGRLNGTILKLGVRRAEFDNRGDLFGDNALGNNMVVYELQPGSDFTPDPGVTGTAAARIVAIGNKQAIAGSGSNVTSSQTADAFVVGRGFASKSYTNYEGSSMAISAYTTFVKVN